MCELTDIFSFLYPGVAGGIVSFFCQAEGDPYLYIELICIFPFHYLGVAGGIVSFFCQAEGDPHPYIEWRRNGKKVRSQRYMIIEMAGGIQLTCHSISCCDMIKSCQVMFLHVEIEMTGER